MDISMSLYPTVIANRRQWQLTTWSSRAISWWPGYLIYHHQTQSTPRSAAGHGRIFKSTHSSADFRNQSCAIPQNTKRYGSYGWALQRGHQRTAGWISTSVWIPSSWTSSSTVVRQGVLDYQAKGKSARVEIQYQQEFWFWSIRANKLPSLSWAASLSSVIIIGLCRCTDYVPHADANAERGSDWPVSAGVSSNDRSGAPRAGWTLQVSTTELAGHARPILSLTSSSINMLYILSM